MVTVESSVAGRTTKSCLRAMPEPARAIGAGSNPGLSPALPDRVHFFGFQPPDCAARTLGPSFEAALFFCRERILTALQRAVIGTRWCRCVPLDRTELMQELLALGHLSQRAGNQLIRCGQPGWIWARVTARSDGRKLRGIQRSSE